LTFWLGEIFNELAVSRIWPMQMRVNVWELRWAPGFYLWEENKTNPIKSKLQSQTQNKKRHSNTDARH